MLAAFSDSKSYPKRKTVYTAFSSFWWNRSCWLVFPFNILSGSILSKAPLMFLFFNLLLLVSSFEQLHKKNNIIWNFLRFLIEFYLFAGCFFLEFFYARGFSRVFQVIGGSDFRKNPANFLHFEPKLEHLECGPFKSAFTENATVRRGCAHSNWGCAHSNSWHAHSKCWGVFCHQKFKLYNIFDHLLSCQNHHSKCMFSPHISVKYVKITLFIRYSYFFFLRGLT